jgi:hypothetical protein
VAPHGAPSSQQGIPPGPVRAGAVWRLERAERIEAELFEYRRGADGDLALALIRDGNPQPALGEALPQQPNKPETRTNAGESGRAWAAEPGAGAQKCGPEAAAPPWDPHEGRSLLLPLVKR